jgi:hypothetical protein
VKTASKANQHMPDHLTNDRAELRRFAHQVALIKGLFRSWELFALP